MEIHTLTGLTMQEVAAKLRETLPDDAYNALPGAAHLTDINPAYLWETLTTCFGLAGYGWFYKKGELITELVDDGTKKSNWIRAMFDAFTLFYRLDVDGQIVTVDGIESNGASENADFSYAVRGATTNALGGAARMLLWQLRIYKGKNQPRPGKQDTSTVLRNDGNPADFVISFGTKFPGQTVAAIYAADEGISYLQWMASPAFEARNDKAKRAKIAAAAYLASKEAPPESRPTIIGHSGGYDNWQAPPESPPKTQEADSPHWGNDEQTRKRYFAWLNEHDWTPADAKEALKVKSMKDYDGSIGDAFTALTEARG